MFVTPAPVGLLIVVVELDKRRIFAVVVFYVHLIRLIFITVPLMIVIVLFVMVGDTYLRIRGSQ